MERELHYAEMKMCEEARHRVALDVKERQQRVDALRNKYETVASRLRGSAGTEHSQVCRLSTMQEAVLRCACRRIILSKLRRRRRS